jgi:hypothetical protein
MVVRTGFSHSKILLKRREDQWMVVRSGFSHRKILGKKRGPVDGCEVWFYPHKNPVKGEDQWMVVRSGFYCLISQFPHHWLAGRYIIG